MSEATPRPWRVVSHRGEWGIIADDAITGGAKCIYPAFDATRYGYKDSTEVAANADLIVRAVNLFDAHEAVIEAARELEHTAKIINDKRHAGNIVGNDLWSDHYAQRGTLAAALASLDALKGGA